MKIPKAIENVIEGFERLPGIGPKSAQRLGFYLLRVPQSDLDDFAQSLSNLKKNTMMCGICSNIGNAETCEVCADPQRDSSTICVVEDPLDVIAVEKSGKYDGLYHVLHGVIDPLNSIGPDDIFIPQLIRRIRESGDNVKEVIVATNPTMEGDATSMYLVKQLKAENNDLRITRIGRGLPVGADIEYADETTIGRALEGRREY